MAKETLEQRRDRRERLEAHAERNAAATEAREAREAELEEFAELPPDEKQRRTRERSLELKREHAAAQQKAAAGPPENKALAGPGANKTQLRELTKPELIAMAEKRGVEVTRGDGKDLDPLKADYVRALAG